MKAIAVTRYKKPLEIINALAPTPEAGQVLIEVGAAGLNHLDEKIREGEFRQLVPYRAPFVLGHDVAGTVVELGPEVTGFAVGDVVFGRPRDGAIGTFAERIVVDQADLALAPRSIPIEVAAGLPLVALTAWQALVEIGKVQRGQRVLIHAGAGAVGSVAIQLAKHLGAEVATTVSTGSVELAKNLGADVVIDYRTQNFEEILSGYDLVLDSLGEKSVKSSLRVLAPGGVVIGIAGPPTKAFAKRMGLGAPVQFVTNALSASTRRLAKRLGVTYEFLWMHASGEQLASIASLVDSGAIRPSATTAIDFEQIPAALTGLVAGGTRGKVAARIANPATSTQGK